MRVMIGTTQRHAARCGAWTLAALLLGSVGASVSVDWLGAPAARAQMDVAPQQAPADIPPPPQPCAPLDGAACPSCTTDVPGASPYQNGLPVPSPLPGHHYVVQLVNESNVTILAGANAAHRGSSVPNGPVPPPIAVLPREGTWVMQPKGAPNNANILTIDIPPEWEGTQCPQSNQDCQANGPRFFPRTGCKYDIAANLAQCETGSCGDAYDCGQQALRDPPRASAGRAPVSIVEWTFNSQGGQGYNYPDISLVDGVSLTVDVQAIGPHCASKAGVPSEPNWLSENQPLAIHGADLRDPGRCLPTFRLTRGEIGQLIQGQGDPDDTVACFTNCGRYEYPDTPGAGCDPSTDPRCRNWLAFCCYAPPGDPDHVYGGMCSSNSQCAQSGGCWDLVTQPAVCACRAFNKNAGCPADVCTHPNPPNYAAQPEFGLCTDVTGNPDECIGDDTIHAVFPGGYTWPNDPQTYLSDARAYRIIFAPGFDPTSNARITDSGAIPLCASLPPQYGYDVESQICAGVAGKQFAGAALVPACQSDDDCPIIPGSTPPAHASCDPLHKRCSTWACAIAPGGPVNTGGLLCSWGAAASPSPTASPTPARPGGLPGTPTPRHGAEDDGCAVTAPCGGSGGALPALLLFGVLLRLRRRR
ncbi:MAG: thaumatin family protein [Deltaproteobacteria bacterium]|nr:thaumatin family protein [Deltaproteobacteria bacterium]